MRRTTISRVHVGVAWLGKTVFAIGGLACVLVLCAQRAGAVILPASTLDGPSEEIVGFGGVAMAEDGTGGVVYLKRVAGVAHVFAARFIGGGWQPPVRVDTEEPFAASWPRIAAANGGQLVVVWATPFATESERPVDELLGATLGQGSSSFGRAILIDPDIRDGTGTSPYLAMSTSGQADVVYRVVHNTRERETLGIPLLRPGDVVADVRMAHYNGERWSRLGAINRNSGVSMRPPSETNAPRIAIGPAGNGVVVWQEPDIDGVARIWARRFFGSTLNYVMPVSASSLAGSAIGIDADAPSVAISRLGQAVVAYRQAGGPGSPLPGARIFLSTLPDGESADGSQFTGASIVDPAAPGGSGVTIGPPSIDIDDKQDLRVLYDANGEPRVVQGNDLGLAGTLSLGPPFAGGELSSASVMNPAGGGVSAWPSADRHGNPALAVREDFSQGGVQTAILAGGSGGEIGELAVARSGLGDGMVAFRQGALGAAAIVVVRATAPPVQFVVSVPRTWVRPSQAIATWQDAPSANGPIAYHLVVDGRVMPTPAGVFSLRVDTRGLSEGTHSIQVLALDRVGQATLSSPSALQLDNQPPTVTIVARHGGRVVNIHITDAGGLKPGSVSVSFGDGQRAGGRTRLTHRYRHPGTYTITVRAGDRTGNLTTVRRPVSVP
jgi:hypothetical protein